MKFSSSSPSLFFLLKHGQGMWPSANRLKMLQARLIKAVISMYSASIAMSLWLITLSVASMQSQTTITQIISTLARAPMTSALWYPHVIDSFGIFCPIHIETMLIANPPTSESI
jgi:hypothetical protein